MEYLDKVWITIRISRNQKPFFTGHEVSYQIYYMFVIGFRHKK